MSDNTILIDALSNIDDEYLDGYFKYKEKRKKSARITKWSIIAACICIPAILCATVISPLLSHVQLLNLIPQELGIEKNCVIDTDDITFGDGVWESVHKSYKIYHADFLDIDDEYVKRTAEIFNMEYYRYTTDDDSVKLKTDDKIVNINKNGTVKCDYIRPIEEQIDEVLPEDNDFYIGEARKLLTEMGIFKSEYTYARVAYTESFIFEDGDEHSEKIGIDVTFYSLLGDISSDFNYCTVSYRSYGVTYIKYRDLNMKKLGCNPGLSKDEFLKLFTDTESTWWSIPDYCEAANPVLKNIVINEIKETYSECEYKNKDGYIIQPYIKIIGTLTISGKSYSFTATLNACPPEYYSKLEIYS